MLIDSKTVDVLQNRRFDVKIFYRLMERVSGHSSFGSRSTTSHQCSDQPAIPSLCNRHVGSAQSAYVRTIIA